MDDYEIDEAESFGLGGLYPEEESEETANITAASSRGALMFGGPEIQARYGEAVKGYEESTKEVLDQIEKAKNRLLNQPTAQSKSEQLRGLAMALAAPRERGDPRFYERRNLYTFLRDIGEYGASQKKAEKETLTKREDELAKLNELRAKYEQQSAFNLMKSLEPAYRESMRPAAAARTPSSEFERLIANLPAAEQERLRQQRARTMATRAPKEEKTGPEGEAAQLVWARRTLVDPNASAADKAAAQDFLQRKEPKDIRLEKIKNQKYAGEYLSRIKDQAEFTIPDIESAIAQIDKGGVFAAGNVSRIIRGVPIIGQRATDLEKTLDSIKSRVGFDKMRELKDKSPTGSTGLGAVSNAEQRLLQSVKGSLDENQSPQNLRKNLERLKNFYEKEAFDILNREAGIQGLTGIDDALSSLESTASSEPSSGSKKKRIKRLPSGRIVEIED